MGLVVGYGEGYVWVGGWELGVAGYRLAFGFGK